MRERVALGIVCLAALIASPVHAAIPTPIQNSVKYKDAGTKPATGRSGSAAIAVRALRGQNATDIDVSTGDAGTLDKVQVKLFAADGTAVVTDNHRNAGNAATFTYAWPQRGQHVQVQANVSGIDPKRTDVVTVDSTVQLRPDLTVAALNVPQKAYANAPVPITAVIGEANGDTGARANCVLKADGVVIDQANGIWVDAGDTVSVEFRATFATLGTKQLSVELTNVTPGDYDPTNNSASASIEIVSPAVRVSYVMNAWDMTYDQVVPWYGHEDFLSSGINASYSTDETGGSSSSRHVAMYSAFMQVGKVIQFPVAVDGLLTMDGQPVIQSHFDVTENANSVFHCGEDSDNYHWVMVCTFPGDAFGDRSTIFFWEKAGTVTYASWSTSTTRWQSGAVNVYTNNQSGSGIEGALVSPIPASLGNNIAVHAAMTDAASTHFAADAAVQLAPLPDFSDDAGESCNSFDYTVSGIGRYTGWFCSHSTSVAHGRFGTSSGELQE
jgi:hypothetical protein